MENIYDINSFKIKFFTKQDIKFFVNDNFKLQNINRWDLKLVNIFVGILYMMITNFIRFITQKKKTKGSSFTWIR